MSPRLGTSGKRRRSTSQGNGSISENHAAVQPNGLNATDAASMPEQTEPKRIITSPCFRSRPHRGPFQRVRPPTRTQCQRASRCGSGQRDRLRGFHGVRR